jgi:hypothetical protein
LPKEVGYYSCPVSKPFNISCSGPEPMDAVRTNGLARRRPKTDTSISCNGREPMGALGTKRLARRRPKTDTSIFCSGPEPIGAVGTKRLARRQPKTDTSMYCSGREPMGAIGTAAENGHLHILQWGANGCPCDVGACARLARRKGHDAVNDWIAAANNGDYFDDDE